MFKRPARHDLKNKKKGHIKLSLSLSLSFNTSFYHLSVSSRILLVIIFKIPKTKTEEEDNCFNFQDTTITTKINSSAFLQDITQSRDHVQEEFERNLCAFNVRTLIIINCKLSVYRISSKQMESPHSLS